MISFLLSIAALLVGYFFYGRFVERVFGPDDRVTPAVAKADGLDFVAFPSWKVFMIQFLNIAGTGPIFGAIMGAKFGPAAYLWIVFGCIFAGAVHDYMIGMLSLRHEGEGLPALIRRYLGRTTHAISLLFVVLVLLILGSVFVYSPAEILSLMGGSTTLWVLIIFAYYVLATMLPIDKLIGRVYPLFAFALLFMAAALMAVLLIRWPDLPEVWNHLYNMGSAADSSFTDQLFPCLFITIACGAISGFHATQTPLMARCVKSERIGRPAFYGAMITEGVVALVWATVSMYFFYDAPTPGYEQIAAATDGFHTSAPKVVYLICNDWLGIVGGILAVLGVVAAPITSGDTAFRSARLILGDWLKVDQRPIIRRLCICVPLFVASIIFLLWQIENPDGFNTVWQYFGWSNQTMSVLALWTITVYLVKHNKRYVIALLPALFMTFVCATYFFISKQTLHLAEPLAYGLGVAVLVIAAVWFVIWYRKQSNNNNQ